MLDPAEREGQAQERWWSRFARGRKNLSDSIDETMTEPIELEEEKESDEVGEVVVEESKNALLIPPRLSLQSRQLPAIPIEPERIVKPVAKHTLTDLPAETKEPSTEKRQRPGARMTKVHLQAVSKSEKKPVKTSQPEESKTVTNEAVERLPKQHMPAEQVFALARLKPDTSPEKLAGKGMILQGQAEVTIENKHVTASSIVVVNLLDNPGPVVVQYYSLLPSYGFKVHLSAPAISNTAFNYVILLGEVF
jgi:hypothetical protein